MSVIRTSGVTWPVRPWSQLYSTRHKSTVCCQSRNSENVQNFMTDRKPAILWPVEFIWVGQCDHGLREQHLALLD